MARGDVQSNTYHSLTTGSSITIQPASGDEYFLITLAASLDEQVGYGGYDGTNNTGALRVGMKGDETDAGKHQASRGFQPFKACFTNTEYGRVSQEGGSTVLISLILLETK